jgi:hypothetical protein
MQSDQTPRGLFEDTLAVTGRQVLAFVIAAIAAVASGGIAGWAIGVIAFALALVPAGYFRDLWDDRANRRAIAFGLLLVMVVSALFAVLASAAITWTPWLIEQGLATLVICAHGILASAAVQALAAAIALVCLRLGVGLPDFIDE